ncbi:hypothetical protein [Actinoplanes sp. NPDC051494]|uniref:hypothetical protein n=1 Tax=Actinoplanes sp. NPDC051494 TaxID=3363907 RepID=UPI0037B378B9
MRSRGGTATSKRCQQPTSGMSSTSRTLSRTSDMPVHHSHIASLSSIRSTASSSDATHPTITARTVTSQARSRQRTRLARHGPRHHPGRWSARWTRVAASTITVHQKP